MFKSSWEGSAFKLTRKHLLSPTFIPEDCRDMPRLSSCFWRSCKRAAIKIQPIDAQPFGNPFPAGKIDGLILLEQETLPSATGEAQKPRCYQALIRDFCGFSCPRPSGLGGLRALVPHVPIFPVGNAGSREQPPAALQSFSMTSLQQQNAPTKPSLEPFILPFELKSNKLS